MTKILPPDLLYAFMDSVSMGWATRFLQGLSDADMITYFPELYALKGVPQNPQYHPEGDAYVHTLLTMDQASEPQFVLTMMCHDYGKATNTVIDEKGVIRSPKHEIAGVEPTRAFLKRLQEAGDMVELPIMSNRTIESICTLVELHMIHVNLNEKMVRRTLRRLMDVGLEYDALVEVCRCDMSGRPPLPAHTPEVGQTIAAKLIAEDAMTPIVTDEMIEEFVSDEARRIEIVAKALELQDRGTMKRDGWQRTLHGCGFKEIPVN